jgi:hypothetical protein
VAFEAVGIGFIGSEERPKDREPLASRRHLLGLTVPIDVSGELNFALGDADHLALIVERHGLGLGCVEVAAVRGQRREVQNVADLLARLLRGVYVWLLRLATEKRRSAEEKERR